MFSTFLAKKPRTVAEAARVAESALGGKEEFSKIFEYADTFWAPDPPVGVESRVVLATKARENELERARGVRLDVVATEPKRVRVRAVRA